METLDVQGVTARLRDALYALQARNTKSAEILARQAVEDLASYHIGKKVMVVCQPDRSREVRG